MDVFKHFHVSVKRENGKKLKCICVENRGKYLVLFDEYYKTLRIHNQRTHPKASQLNGLAEIMNRILIDRVRYWLLHAKLLRFY